MHDQNVSKKDMSIPARYAIKEFSGLLTQYQKTKQEAFLKYISGRFNFLNLNYKKSMKDLLFTLKNGGISLKVRSLYMIIIIKLTKGKYEND